MSLFDAINVSASGLTAERTRLNVVAENIANANTVRGADGQPYQRKQVVLAQQPGRSFSSALDSALGPRQDGAPGGVRVAAIVPDGNPGQRVYDPSNPDADADGYVTMPNVNIVQEMTDMIAASRSYEANATALNTAKAMYTKTLEVLR